ncbi:23482_t:CDS:2, partial [Gigaspora margarita]
KKNPNNPCARISGVHVFCLNILDIEKEHERKHRSSSFRLFNTLSESMKTKRSCAFSVQLDKAFKNEDYLANYNKEKTSSFDAFVKVIDQGPISQDAYRKLATLQPELPRDHNISDARKNINEEMNKQ